MIKFFFIILIIFSSCSLEKKSFFKNKNIAENQKIDLKEIDSKEIIKEDFNKDIKINLSKTIKNNKFKELRNNYGREEFDSDLNSVSKYKIKKIKNFLNFEPQLVFNPKGLIFFEKEGTLKKYDYSKELIWKKNIYSKQEKKSDILINLAYEKDILIITTKENSDHFKALLKSGKDLGIKLSYKIQKKPNGIAEAFIIGEEFIRVFEEESHRLGPFQYLAQGTLYPDVIESAGTNIDPKTGERIAVKIKSHHNVGGLPKRMKLKLLEPLRELFKDEVRNLGRELGLPESVLMRHPFPGPGLGVRVVGDLSQNKLRVLREADHIFIEELINQKLYHKLWQAFCVFLPVRSVGVMGDERTYENVICLRAVTSSDAMTADWAQLPDAFLRKVSNRIINEVKGANRVVYDISSKPPGTIEWE